MDAKTYRRFASRLRAYRCAFDKFAYSGDVWKCGLILNRLKLAESEEKEQFIKFKNNGSC